MRPIDDTSKSGILESPHVPGAAASTGSVDTKFSIPTASIQPGTPSVHGHTIPDISNPQISISKSMAHGTGTKFGKRTSAAAQVNLALVADQSSKIEGTGTKFSSTRSISAALSRNLAAASPQEIGYTDVYADDFFAFTESKGTSREQKAIAANHLSSWLQMMERLGLPFDIRKAGKVIMPTQCGEVLGVVFDTVKHEVRLSMEKVGKLTANIDAFMDKNDASLHEVQVLHGRLNWAGCVIWGLRLLLFGLRRMMRVAAPSELGHHAPVIEVSTRRDLELIKTVLLAGNRRPIRRQLSTSGLPFNLETDGSLTGGGCWFGGHSLSFHWARRMEPKDMAYSEALSLRLTLEEWGHRWFRNRNLTVFVDNEGLWHLLNGGKLRSPDERLQRELVTIALICMANCTQLHAFWFDSESNAYSDAASRVSDPREGPFYTKKLEELTHEWRRHHTPWRDQQAALPKSKQEQAEADLGATLLAEWRKQASADSPLALPVAVQ